MSSKASVRNFLAKKEDAKSVKSSRSSRSANKPERLTDKSGETNNKLLDLAGKIGGNVKAINAVKRETVEFVTDAKSKLASFRHNKAADQEKKEISFQTLIDVAPKNTWIAYELNRTYGDKMGNRKRVYCKSAFFKGSYQVSSASTMGNDKIVESKAIVRAGNRDWHLGVSDFYKIYIYKCMDYINMDFTKLTEIRLAKSRSKSLGHDKGTDKLLARSLPKEGKRSKRLSGGTDSANPTTEKLLRRPRSIAH